jgi:hypothetical protein
MPEIPDVPSVYTAKTEGAPVHVAGGSSVEYGRPYAFARVPGGALIYRGARLLRR